MATFRRPAHFSDLLLSAGKNESSITVFQYSACPVVLMLLVPVVVIAPVVLRVPVAGVRHARVAPRGRAARPVQAVAVRLGPPARLVPVAHPVREAPLVPAEPAVPLVQAAPQDRVARRVQAAHVPVVAVAAVVADLPVVAVLVAHNDSAHAQNRWRKRKQKNRRFNWKAPSLRC